MEVLYNNYLKSKRNLVKEFIVQYKDDNYDDNYRQADEFLLDYTFGKYERGDYILSLEESFQSSLEQLIRMELTYEDSFK
jgi:hypothetical protein